MTLEERAKATANKCAQDARLRQGSSVQTILEAFREVEAETEARVRDEYADMALHYEKLRARLEEKPQGVDIHEPMETNPLQDLVDKSVEHAKKHGLPIWEFSPEYEPFRKVQANPHEAEKSQAEQCMEPKRALYVSSRAYGKNTKIISDFKEAGVTAVEIECAVEWPSDDEIIEIFKTLEGTEFGYDDFPTGVKWARANTKIKSVDEVRAEVEEDYQSLMEDLSLSVKRHAALQEKNIEDAKTLIKETTESRAKIKVMRDALESIEVSSGMALEDIPPDVRPFVRRAREALKKVGDIG